jgi:hypothetical protein
LGELGANNSSAIADLLARQAQAKGMGIKRSATSAAAGLLQCAPPFRQQAGSGGRANCGVLMPIDPQLLPMPQLDFSSLAQALAHRGPQRERVQQQRILIAQQGAEAKAPRKPATSRTSPVVSNPTPEGYRALMLRYPDRHEGLKASWDQYSEGQRERNVGDAAAVYGAISNGRSDLALDRLKTRRDALAKGGEDTHETDALIEALESGDPAKIKQAQGLAGMVLAAAVGPDKIGSTLDSLTTASGRTASRTSTTGGSEAVRAETADDWLATQDTKLVPVQAGGKVFAFGPTGAGAPQMEGGDQSTSAGATLAMPVQGGTFTSGFGAPRDGGKRVHNGIDIAAPSGSPVLPVKPGTVVAVGNDPKSGLFVRVKHLDGTLSGYGHLGHQAVTVGQEVTATTPLGTVGATGNATGNVLHLTVRDSNGRAVDPRPMLGATVVRTQQQYDRLPSGAQYIAPDGSHRVKS